MLNQGAFLSVYAHASETAPGPARRRASCGGSPACRCKSPTELNIMVTPPLPDPTKTTRQRFDIHATDPLCRSCHTSIDAFGFAFEGFDGMGQARTHRQRAAGRQRRPWCRPVSDFDGSYADSNALATALAGSADVRTCVARQLFRASAGRSDDSAAGAEDGLRRPAGSRCRPTRRATSSRRWSPSCAATSSSSGGRHETQARPTRAAAAPRAVRS